MTARNNAVLCNAAHPAAAATTAFLGLASFVHACWDSQASFMLVGTRKLCSCLLHIQYVLAWQHLPPSTIPPNFAHLGILAQLHLAQRLVLGRLCAHLEVVNDLILVLEAGHPAALLEALHVVDALFEHRDHFLTCLAARTRHRGQELVVDVVEQRAQLFCLRVAHVAAKQLVSCALVLSDALDLRLHAHLVECAAQEGTTHGEAAQRQAGSRRGKQLLACARQVVLLFARDLHVRHRELAALAEIG
eukprot:357392-Chlamydomonas_euryale.AAC.33